MITSGLKVVIMVRTQVQLTSEQFRALKAASAAEGVSISELIRQAVDMILEARGAVGMEERIARALSIAGRFRSGLGDLAERHDDYFAGEAGPV